MNITSTVHNVTDALKGSPVLLLVLILNLTALAGFAYILHEVSAAIERREVLLKQCLDK